ncbi:MAG: class I SAM-dependent methyltransferase [Armatimonadetes bacterium]|nr:class I SAM-dependent methyltransferase [Armatimonadota bacterium]
MAHPPRGISAYQLPERVASYDADMEVMHPNRSRMVEVALDFLACAPKRAVDLGIGTGYFTHRLLEKYPQVRVIAIDGSEDMLRLARGRLGGSAGQVDFRSGDFRRLAELAADARGADLVYSSYALHHLSGPEKLDVLQQALRLLRPGGWLINADLIVAEDPVLEQRIQALRRRGIVARAGGRDPRFGDEESTRQYLERLEAQDGDQPLTLTQDLELMKNAGFHCVGPIWVEHREAVICGSRPSVAYRSRS